MCRLLPPEGVVLVGLSFAETPNSLLDAQPSNRVHHLLAAMQSDVDMLAGDDGGSRKSPPEPPGEMDLKPPARPDGANTAPATEDPFPLVGCPSRNLNLFLRQIATIDAARLVSDVENSGSALGMDRLVAFWEGLGRGLDSVGAGNGTGRTSR